MKRKATDIHPKVAAAAVAAIIAIALLFGFDLDDETAAQIAAVLLPVIAGYVKLSK